MKCTVYETGTLGDYKYVVTFARYGGKWILCKHRQRDTWENSGGHIEPGETPEEAARRELYEEAGVTECAIEAVCDYWACDEPHEKGYSPVKAGANGAVFLADVTSLGELPESEMEMIQLYDDFPANLTYPLITKTLLPRVLKKLAPKPEASGTDLKLSELLELQAQLQAKYKDTWPPNTPENGRNSLLWTVGELGEAAAIIKKRGEALIMSDPVVRAHFVEEFADVLMYISKTMLCYDIGASELSDAFIKKHAENMVRWS